MRASQATSFRVDRKYPKGEPAAALITKRLQPADTNCKSGRPILPFRRCGCWHPPFVQSGDLPHAHEGFISMTHRVYNFGAGPATLPLPVLQRIQEELLDFQGIGASIIEISHRTPQFEALLNECKELLVELMDIPPNYRVVFAHGGGQMQYAMVPLNLIARKPARKALYARTGLFAGRAIEEARKYGEIVVVADSEPTGFDHIPDIDPAGLDRDASYLYIVTNNTVQGTQWKEFPETDGIPLVGDATSEILSRPIDVARFGLLYAGAQKNLGPAGLAAVIVREDLLNCALPETPSLLDYSRLVRDNSLTNTANVFAIYVTNLVLHWVKDAGGPAAMQAQNEKKAAVLYDVLDRSGFYRPHARKEHRSTMNVTFSLPGADLLERFVSEAASQGLYKIKGHPTRGGVRVSLYNAMTPDGVQAMAAFMEEFERRNG